VITETDAKQTGLHGPVNRDRALTVLDQIELRRAGRGPARPESTENGKLLDHDQMGATPSRLSAPQDRRPEPIWARAALARGLKASFQPLIIHVETGERLAGIRK